jgi:hypothetical protein
MALFTSASPDIQIKEVDLSGVVPGTSTSTGAFVGKFAWGPANEPTLVSNEAGLVSAFGSPTVLNDSATLDYLSAGQFLKYGNSLFVSRAVGTADLNAVAASTGTQVENEDDWDTVKSGLTSRKFIAKYPGSAGNSLRIEICPWSTGDSAYDAWTYANRFDGAPRKSDYVDARWSNTADSGGDEAHVVVIDEDGQFTGTPNTVLETFPFVSFATDAKGPEGQGTYILDVLDNQSEYIWGAGITTDFSGAGVTAANFDSVGTANHDVVEYSLTNGVSDSGYPTVANLKTAWDDFEDPDLYQVDFLIAPGMQTQADQVEMVNDLVATAGTLRKDCVVVASPNRSAVVNVAPATAVSRAVATADLFTASSYLIVDNNYLKVYDKYNDAYEYIPAASSTAGIMSATDRDAAPWFSPAGQRRGQYLGITGLAYNADKAQRDTLYRANINPIVNLPGQGILLFGDKTKLGRPSAFDRINVRRLFLAVERAVKGAASNVMFEFNDEFTRAEFVNIVEPFLREIQGRRGITDFRVVCDETNNTSAIIDNNQFVASVFIQPARSINFVTLNFVATRTGVSFDEVVGRV